jgi:hypothetical protein
MILGEKQELFVKLQAEWVPWVLSHPGWHLREGEGRILQMGPDGKGRRARHALTGLPLRVKDLVHMDGGTHYLGIGKDWNLFIDPGAEGNAFGSTKLWVSSGSHPAWLQLGVHWELMHELCRWGGRFGDANHFSLEHDGKK